MSKQTLIAEIEEKISSSRKQYEAVPAGRRELQTARLSTWLQARHIINTHFEGKVLVPVEPTEEMLLATKPDHIHFRTPEQGETSKDFNMESARIMYKAMIEAKGE